ncbi:hypothetical protein N7501_002615 [Penicillium viridicatum]|nr:hypothetical protein N7501_002615 [Penicillium viridicatum]
MFPINLHTGTENRGYHSSEHPQCIPCDLSSDYDAQTLSHLSKNTHEKAPFDLGVDLHGPQQC